MASDEPCKKINYSIKNISAIGAGLINAETNIAAHFTVYTRFFPSSAKPGEPDPRDYLDFSIEGPSEPGPMRCDNNDQDGSVDVTWTPILAGEYLIYIFFNGMNINGSPFKVSVTGESIRAHTLISKVTVTGDNFKEGVAGELNKIRIDCGDKSIAGGLTVSIAGPKGAAAKLTLVKNDDITFDVVYEPTLAGFYQLHVKIAQQHIPGSPFPIKVLDRPIASPVG